MSFENDPLDPAPDRSVAGADIVEETLAVAEEIDDLDMSELGELYVALVFHAVRAKKTDPVATAKLDEAIDAFFAIINAGCREDLRDVVLGINHALYDAAENHLTLFSAS